MVRLHRLPHGRPFLLSRCNTRSTIPGVGRILPIDGTSFVPESSQKFYEPFIHDFGSRFGSDVAAKIHVQFAGHFKR